LARAIEVEGEDAKDVRKASVAVLRRAIDQGRTAIAKAFTERPMTARPTLRAYNFLTDGVIEATFYVATQYLHPNPNPTEGERLSVIAVGGYGRGEMAPHSDVDLLFLMPWKVTPWAESLIESMLYVFWDLHLKVGHASRSIKDCLRLGREDYTIRTSLLENRHLTGDAALAAELHDKLKSELFSGTVADFIEAKGGLRDLQTLYWIGKYIHGVNSARELVGYGLFSQEEYDRFRAAETFLMAARCHLHLVAGRPTEQLTFDMQVEVAERMGYTDKGGRRAVEHFMQDYFRHATA
ncbi:unnamed protein product, partial [Ectocarpus sp. 12 AP-2014]